eukprot:4455450-Pyramimonas_sp.AAC.1
MEQSRQMIHTGEGRGATPETPSAAPHLQLRTLTCGGQHATGEGRGSAPISRTRASAPYPRLERFTSRQNSPTGDGEELGLAS